MLRLVGLLGMAVNPNLDAVTRILVLFWRAIRFLSSLSSDVEMSKTIDV